MSESERLATREFVAQLVRALEVRVEAERKALEAYQDSAPGHDADEPDRVRELMRGIQRADDFYDLAVADASDAFRRRLEELPRPDEPHSATPVEDHFARSVLDAASEAFVAMDAGGFIVDWNSAAERTFGWSRDEAVGRVLSDTIIPEDFRSAHLRGLQRYLDTGKGAALDRRLELLAVSRDGREFPVELTISTIPGQNVPRFCAFIRELQQQGPT